MRNRMAVRAVLLGRLLQLPVEWTDCDGMVHFNVKFFGPMAGYLLREAHTFWRERAVSKYCFLELKNFWFSLYSGLNYDFLDFYGKYF